MTAIEIGTISVLAISLLILSGMHVAVALTLCSFVGVWAIRDDFQIAQRLLGLAAADSISTYDLAVVPLFVLMGLLIAASEVAVECFRAANYLFRRVAGGVGVATVLGNAVLAAVTGVTIASVTIFTKLAVPEMLKLGYKPRFAVGLVAGSGILGMLIPPSLLMIIYCLVTETSVTRMFLAAIVPGLLLTALLILGVILMCWKWPAFAGRPERPADGDRDILREMIGAMLPLALLILLTFGGIYGGFFTATEAGAVGAFGAFLLALFRGKLNRRSLKIALIGTGTTTAAICILITAANMYGRMIVLSGIPALLSETLANAQLGVYALVFFYVLLLIVLGMFLDSISIMLLTVPLLLPTFNAMGIHLVWIGIVTVLAIEIGLVTPPLGINAFVVKSSLHDQSITLADVFAGSVPFIFIMLITLLILVAFPSITTFLL
jgi:C4-dicarboxylate transporter DctM subunit